MKNDNTNNDSLTADITFEDLEKEVLNTNIHVQHIEDCRGYDCRGCETNESDVDHDSNCFTSLWLQHDPHLQHNTNVEGGASSSYVLTCLDCRVEKAIKDVELDIKNSTDIPYDPPTKGLMENYSEAFLLVKRKGLDQMELRVPSETEITTYQKRRCQKAERVARKKERKKRRKIIEDLIRLEGELNSGMGNWAFDTQSEPVSKICQTGNTI